jgi:hypothetical protein
VSQYNDLFVLFTWWARYLTVPEADAVREAALEESPEHAVHLPLYAAHDSAH